MEKVHMHVRVRNSWIKHFDFIIADLVCLNLIFLFTYFLRHRKWDMYLNNDYRNLVIVVVILHLCVMFFSNFYSGILSRGYLDEFKKVLIHNVALTGLMFAYLFGVQLSDIYSRIMLVSFFFMDTVAMYMVHIILKYIQRKSGKQEVFKQKILVIATPKLAEEAVSKIISGPDKKYQIVGIGLTEDSDIKQIGDIPVVACGDMIWEFACRNVVDGAFLCLGSSGRNEIEEFTNRFLEMGITVHINMDMFNTDFPNVYFGHMNSASVMTTSVNAVSLTEAWAKRAIDICAGLVGCFITLVLFIFVAPAIKIADPKGPVFFGQVRAGKNGRPFKIYKFRSMYSDAEERKKELMSQNKMDGLMFKIDADPRIIGSGPDGTKKGLGHFLRATSLDEFPNFWSILKGDMSLVGTRPPTMDEYEQYELHHKSRLAAKPGLTGMWQVSGRSDLTDFEEIVRLDNEYIRNWTIGLDIRIILKTVMVVLTRKGSV